MAEDEQNITFIKPGPLVKTQRQRVFISYGRADALKFVRRLAADLKQHEHRVWLDLDDIEKGGLFDVRVERGIRHCTVFICLRRAGEARARSPRMVAICRHDPARRSGAAADSRVEYLRAKCGST